MVTDWTLCLTLARAAAGLLPHHTDPTWPPVVRGLLSSLLPSLDSLAPLRADLAQSLRAQATAVWFRDADLAELCAVLDGIHRYDSTLVTGADLAAFLQRLLAAEAAVGGPYRDADGALRPLTNALVDQCLEWVAAPLPNVTGYLQRSSGAFSETLLSAPERTLLYALRRSPSGRKSVPLTQIYAHGGLFVAALAAQLVAQSDQDTSDIDPATLAYVRTVHARSRNLAITAEPLFGRTRQMLDTVLRVDRDHEITALAWMYGRSRSSGWPAPGNLSLAERAMYEHLGVANVYGWAAYTIYDDFLDEEGDPSLLATANYLTRAMLREYAAAIPDAAFRQFVEDSLATVDAANTYETTRLRFHTAAQTISVGPLPDYGDAELLADRTLPHIIGPLGILAAAGEPIGSPTWLATLQAFRHYLIARQLNDDIHDWVKDLSAGQISYVVTAILRWLGIVPGVYPTDELITYARPHFRQHILPIICHAALQHIAAAKRIPLPGAARLANSQLLRLFDRVEAGLRSALRQRDMSAEFVRELRLPPEPKV